MIFEILGMSETRFITIYFAQGLLFFLFVYLSYKILKRDTKRLNLVFALFYISASIGLGVNFIYGPINDAPTVYFLNFITNFFLFIGPVFLLIFSLILWKSQKIITTKKQLIIIFVYGFLIFLMILFPWGDPEWGIYMESPQSPPHWSLPFYIYVITVLIVCTTIPTVNINFKIYAKFEDETLKRKWRFFILGYFFISIFSYGIMTSNMLDIPLFRTIMGFIGLILAIVGGYMLYYGVGKAIEK